MGQSHLFIVYTRQDGNKRFYRGGPRRGNLFSGAAGVTEYNNVNSQPSEGYTSDQNAFSSEPIKPIWGPIYTHWGPWEGSLEQQSYLDSPKGMVTIAEGLGHCNYHARFVLILREIGARGLTYFINGPNSNSVVYTLLVHTGLPKTKPNASTPGWGKNILQATAR